MPHDRNIAILTYHSLDDSGSVLSTAPRLFADQMQTLYELGLKVVPLSEVQHVLDGGAGPKHLVAITFDDGFRSVYEYAVPVLQRYGYTATVFLVTDYCDRTNAWPGQPLSIERRPLLRWSEIREMSQSGIAFGSHTRTHPDLRIMTKRDAEHELVASKKAIEDAIGSAVNVFAYPYGVYDNFTRRLASTHFSLACSATLGFARSSSDPFALERIDMYYLQHPVFFRRLFSTEAHAYISFRRYLRSLRRRAPQWLDALGLNNLTERI
ncbi:MAG: polysaccharide deacetylase family protein [Candidatus Binatia bacterium]